MFHMDTPNISKENVQLTDSDDNIGEDSDDGTGNDACNESFLSLTKLVRRQYCDYLEKQLQQNIIAWRSKQPLSDVPISKANEKVVLQKCRKLLEEKAIMACVHARRYQRFMLQIINDVRQNTCGCRLERNLDTLLSNLPNRDICTQTTQIHNQDAKNSANSKHITNGNMKPSNSPFDDDFSPSLENKIEMFQQRLNGKPTDHSTPKSQHDLKNDNHARNCMELLSPQRQHRKRFRQDREIDLLHGKHEPKANKVSPTTPATTPLALPIPQLKILADTSTEEVTRRNPELSASSMSLEQEDQIALELAQLFREEKTELDELLGIDPNKDTDDPRMCSILEEIENARVPSDLKGGKLKEPQSLISQLSDSESIPKLNGAQEASPSSPTYAYECMDLALATAHNKTAQDLRRSVWPCELFMQRRRLSATLSRLIDEDLRWHELMKWKFTKLFGEDSDDEFAVCSPSIELDETLISSCVKRISPWMVKYLMKPMRDGLIANRYLFKKLAKKLAYAIILEDQYPDERVIKRVVEEFFCLHQAVLSSDDITDLPNLSSLMTLD